MNKPSEKAAFHYARYYCHYGNPCVHGKNACSLHRYPWTSCQIRKIAGAHARGMPGTFSPSPQVSDPDMHHGTCVTHVPWCMPGSLTYGFLWKRRREKFSRHSRRMRNLQFYVSGKRPIDLFAQSGQATLQHQNVISYAMITKRYLLWHSVAKFCGKCEKSINMTFDERLTALEYIP